MSKKPIIANKSGVVIDQSGKRLYGFDAGQFLPLFCENTVEK